MQLSPSGGSAARARLAAASCALLGFVAPPARALDATSSALLYTEPNRVTAFESRADFRFDLRDDRVARAYLTLDALTGASPNGALPSRLAQTFTRPSGQTYQIAPGETPLDPTFRDTRLAGGASYERPFDRFTRGTFGATGSAERDYLSFGLNGRLARDFFQKNTTLSIGVSGSLDDVMALGGTPSALTPVVAVSPFREDGFEGEGEVGKGSELKRVGDVLVGWTQVLDRSTLMQLNYSYSYSSGYLTDPYKIITMIQGPADASPGDPVGYLHEKRPDTRAKQAVFWEAKRALGHDVLDVSYRWLKDDWGIRSKTAEGHFLWEVSPHNDVEPQFRWYHQTTADFWVHSLIDGAPLPDFASADDRLGEFDAYTAALKFAHRFPSGRELGIRVGYYVQKGDGHPADAIGSQRNQDLFPRVSAVMTQVSYSFRL